MSPSLQRRLRRAITRRRALQRLVERSIDAPDLPRRKVQPGSVWAVTMVRNEADVVGQTVRHLVRQGVDGIIVADNLSDVATPQILAELAAESPRVHLTLTTSTPTIKAARCPISRTLRVEQAPTGSSFSMPTSSGSRRTCLWLTT